MVHDIVESGRTARVLADDDDDRFAAQMYARMRDADADGVDVIVAVLPAEEGIGRAVRDRLHKAAAARH